jgi:ubiquitin C-terminal hydrolase
MHGQADTCDVRLGKVSANHEDHCSKLTLKDILEAKRYKNDLILGVIFREGSGASLKSLELNFD